MPNDQELSPEEKLLRVIQSGKAAPAKSPRAAAVTPASVSASVPAPPVAAAPPAAEEKKLRLSKPPVGEMVLSDVVVDAAVRQPAVAAAMVPAVSAVPAAPVASSSPASPVAPGKSLRGQRGALPRANRVLLVAVLLILVLIGIEIVAGISGRPMPEARGGDIMLPPPPEHAEVPAEADVLKLFVDKPWFREDPGHGPDPVNPVAAPATTLGLLGLSMLADGVWEAIIVDKIVGKVHFLKLGDKMLAGENTAVRELTVLRIERDHVVLTDGREEIVLK